MNNNYKISTICFGNKYIPIIEKWKEKIIKKCNIEADILIIDNLNLKKIIMDLNLNILNFNNYAWWDIIRLKKNLKFIEIYNKPIVHIDMDIIIEKDIKDIIDLPYDIIISKEIGEDNAYPKEYSNKLGFGICSGFYCLKTKSKKFMNNILKNMEESNIYSDQYNIMKYLVDNNDKEIIYEKKLLDNKEYTNTIIKIDNIKICVLDFNIIIRDPIINNGQYANHINIDNVGGTNNFLKYFNEDLEDLPLTCRCGKKYLNDYNICTHIKQRKNVI